MAIKKMTRRHTITETYSVDNNQATTTPSAFFSKKDLMVSRSDASTDTAIPYIEMEEDQKIIENLEQPTKNGRTYADLIHGCINDPPLMLLALLLFIFSIFLFNGKISSLKDTWFPFSMSAIFFLIWILGRFIYKKWF